MFFSDMTKNVNITFKKPQSFSKWEDLQGAYVFVTDGSKFLPAVLTYTYKYIIKDNILRDKDGKTSEDENHGTLTYQQYEVIPDNRLGTKLYDYGFITNPSPDNSINQENNTLYTYSTLALSKFDYATQNLINGGEIKPRSELFPYYLEHASTTIVDRNRRATGPTNTISNNDTTTLQYNTAISSILWQRPESIITGNHNNDDDDEPNKGGKGKGFDLLELDLTDNKYSTYLENYGTENGTLTVSYNYVINIPDVDINNNLYICISDVQNGSARKTETKNEELGLFVTYSQSESMQAKYICESLQLKPKNIQDTSDCFRIRTFNQEHLTDFEQWISRNFAKYIENSHLRIKDSDSPVTYGGLAGIVGNDPTKISQRSRIYQIPKNEFAGENKTVDINLFYDGSYICQVNPNLDAFSIDSKPNYSNTITYSYLVSKETGQITLDAFPKHSYNYSYTFVPTISSTTEQGGIIVTYTGTLNTIGQMFTNGSDKERERAFYKWVDDVTFRKSSRKGKTTYETSYTVFVYKNPESDNILDCYAYTSYIFSYTLNGIEYLASVDAFSYLKKYTTNSPKFCVDYSKSKKIWNLTPLGDSDYYVFESAIDEPGQYVLFQFSDNEMITTKNFNLTDENNQIEFTSHSNTFYLNIVQTKSNFNQFIPKVITSDNLSFYQTVINGVNYGWKFAFIRKETSDQSSEIYIGVPKVDNDLNISDSFDKNITKNYDVCLKITYDISEEESEEPSEQTDDIKNIKTISELKQLGDVYYKSLIDVPEITVETEYFWTDDILNKTGHEYTNVTAIQTKSGLEYFGIRSKKHEQNERNNFKFDENKPVLSKCETGTYYLGYDLAGTVFPLSFGKTTDFIYSFKNGAQYLKVNNNWKGKELFPSKISTYEFFVNSEAIRPKYYSTYTSKHDEQVNINCNINELYDNNGELLPIYSTYSISLQYVKNSITNEQLVIKNSGDFEKTTNLIQEPEFVPVSADDKNLILDNENINLYYQEITYTQLKTDIDYIKSIEQNNDCLYKYNSYLNTYELYTIDEIKNLSELDNVYEKFVTYTEITNSSKEYEKKTPYIQNYKYTNVLKDNQPSDKIYYANYNNSKYTYISQGVGIVTDDSIQYYTYTYALITPNELDKYKKSKEDVYIKENYRIVNSKTEFDKLFDSHTKFYTFANKSYKQFSIPTSQLIDDIDLKGNVVYINRYKENNTIIEKAVNVNELKELVVKQNKIASVGINSSEEIEIRKNLTRRGLLTGKTTFAAKNIIDYICVFDYDNKYIEYTDIYENPTKYKFENGKLHYTNDGQPIELDIYINETGYRNISSNLISVGSNQPYYAWRIDKVSHNAIRTLSSSKYEEYVYVDAKKFGFTHQFSSNANYSGILTNPITKKQITIAKVNEYGFIEYNKIKYYSRELVLNQTNDLFMHPNKIYYKSQNNNLRITGTTPIINLTYTQYNTSTNTIKFKYNSPYNEFNGQEYVFNLNTAKYYNNTKILSYLPVEYCEYAHELDTSYDEFIKTEFLYTTYTINDDIHKSKGGAYYTNIYVFDKNNGAINKTLYLNQHIIDVNTYTYKNEEKIIKTVDSDILLKNLSQLDYSDYFVLTETGEEITLNENSDSPAYFYNAPGYILYTYENVETIDNYAAQSLPKKYQYYNNKSKTPITCNVDDNLFGIISYNFDISTTPEGYSYNMFDLEVVKLYRMSRNNLGEILQDRNVKEIEENKFIPFALSNEVEYTATGTYTWHNPIFSYHTYIKSNFSYGWKEVEETTGYWTTDFNKSIKPLQIASYTFYPDINNISNTTSTYSFIPNSYVLSSEVEYPKIAYDTVDVVIEEKFYYSYILGGIEQHYSSSSHVQSNPDGTYTGLIKQHIFDKEHGAFIYADRPIMLTQHKIVTKNTKITNVVNQEQRLDKTLFAYKTSLALTNETVPVLYNTELMPATTKEIQYWNKDTSSYELKTVIASYAYYAYQYMLDTIPLKVSSYLFKASYLTIDNLGELGSYIEKLTYPLAESIKEGNQDFNDWASNYKTAEYEKLLSINKAYDLVSSYVKDGFIKLSDNITTLSYSLTDTLLNTIDKVSYQSSKNTDSIVTTLSAYSYIVNGSIENLDTNLVKSIEEHKETLAYGLDSLTSYIKNIVLGETIEIPESMDIVTKDGIVVSYNMVPNTNINSLGELIIKSFMTASVNTYTYTDENGLTHNIVNYSYTGIGDSLKRLEVVPGIPSKQEFIMDLVPKMFANVDFENEIVDEVKYDELGNITEKKTHKNNPTEIAKKTIYRANILWNELSKNGFC